MSPNETNFSLESANSAYISLHGVLSLRLSKNGRLPFGFYKHPEWAFTPSHVLTPWGHAVHPGVHVSRALSTNCLWGSRVEGAVGGAQRWKLGQVRRAHSLSPRSLGSRLLSATGDAILQVSGCLQPPDPGVSHRLGSWQGNSPGWKALWVWITENSPQRESKPLSSDCITKFNSLILNTAAAHSSLTLNTPE